MSATVRSIQSAKPVRGVKLELVAKNNEVLARGESDSSGHVKFNGPIMRGEGNLAPRMLMGYASNGDFAILDLDRSPVDLTERDIGGREPAQEADAFIYTDRGVYRPGETVHLRAIVRGPDNATPDAFPVTFQIVRPDLRNWRSQTATLVAPGQVRL